MQKLKTVDADTLLTTPMEKTAFIVDGLIPQGVTLLCGASKVGEKLAHAVSWLTGGTRTAYLGQCNDSLRRAISMP